MSLRCGHLFNGIGGFALAAHWMGWANVMHCEIDPFCNKVMNKHFPNSYQHEDIRTTDFTIWRGKLDLITGGFPCQPYSTAGKRKGKDDDHHLWPQMLRAIRQIQPGWIVGENVRGLTDWNGGLVFDEVQADLEAEGYEVLPFLLPACAVNAPHRRDRIWFIAYANNFDRRPGTGRENRAETGNSSESVIANADSNGFRGNDSFGKDRCQEKTNEGTKQREERNEVQRERLWVYVGRDATEGITTNAIGSRQQGQGRPKYSGSSTKNTNWEASWTYNDGGWPTQPPVCNRNDGLSFGLVDITFSKWRNESLKALGNAVVPQIPYQIFKTIEQYLVCA